MTMTLVGECRGWALETELLSCWREHGDLFPHIPTQNRYNRRRRNLMQGFNLLRGVLMRALDLAQDRHCVIDSLPLPVIQFHLVPGAKGEWPAYGAAYGKVPSKKQTIYGYKLHLLITLEGLILDFELAPANASDLAVGLELLSQHTDLTVLGDKAYISAAKAADLWHDNRIRLLTLPKRNQKTQLPAAVQQQFNAVRQMIETVNSQLTTQFTHRSQSCPYILGAVHSPLL